VGAGAQVDQAFGRDKGWDEETTRFNGRLVCCGVKRAMKCFFSEGLWQRRMKVGGEAEVSEWWVVCS